MEQDRPVPFQRPHDRHGARRPDRSPTPAPRNVSAIPPQRVSYSPPPVSAHDPADEFRPRYCPHCQANISTNQTYGYLCPHCFTGLPSWRQETFVKAARGFCEGSCNGMLSKEDRLAQKYMCSSCAGGQERNLRDHFRRDVADSGVRASLHDANMEYNARMVDQLVSRGRCKNIKCGKGMQLSESLVPGSLVVSKRYVYCAHCRSSLAMHFVESPDALFETITEPVTEGIIWKNARAQTSAPVHFPRIDESLVAPDILTAFSNSSRPQNKPIDLNFQIFKDKENDTVSKDDGNSADIKNEGGNEEMTVSEVTDPDAIDPDLVVSNESTGSASFISEDPGSNQENDNVSSSLHGFLLSEFALMVHESLVGGADDEATAARTEEYVSSLAYASPSAYIIHMTGEADEDLDYIDLTAVVYDDPSRRSLAYSSPSGYVVSQNGETNEPDKILNESNHHMK